MPVGDVLPEIAVLLGAVAALLAAMWLPQTHQWPAAVVALAGLAAGAALLALQLGRPPGLTFSGVWALDGGSIWARLLIVAATALTALLGPDWLRGDRRHGEFYAVLLLAALGAMLLAGAADTMQLVMGVLLSSVTGYTLAAFHRDWPVSVEAGMKYFLIGALSNVVLLIGVGLLFGLTGATGYEGLQAWLAGEGGRWTVTFSLALVVVGVGFKLAAFPAHAWMADVAEGAPAPAAAFLTVVPKIGGAVALARLLTLFPDAEVPWRALLAALAVATMTLGNLTALWQSDLRRLIGWSSVSQSGYALAVIVVLGGTPKALPALLFFLAAYAVANIAAFAVVTHLRGRTRLDDYRGLAHARPLCAAVLTLGLLSLVGIPPLAGFVGKLLVFWATLDGGYAWLAVTILLNTVISLFYYLRVIGPMVFDPAPDGVHVLGRWSWWAMVVSGAGVVALGLGAAGALGRFEAAGGLLP